MYYLERLSPCYSSALSSLFVIVSNTNTRISCVKIKWMTISKKLLFRILKYFTVASFNDNQLFAFVKLYLMFVKFSQPLPRCRQCPTACVTLCPVALWHTSLSSLTPPKHCQMSSDTRGFVKGLLFHDICVVSQVQSCG